MKQVKVGVRGEVGSVELLSRGNYFHQDKYDLKMPHGKYKSVGIIGIKVGKKE